MLLLQILLIGGFFVLISRLESKPLTTLAADSDVFSAVPVYPGAELLPDTSGENVPTFRAYKVSGKAEEVKTKFSVQLKQAGWTKIGSVSSGSSETISFIKGNELLDAMNFTEEKGVTYYTELAHHFFVQLKSNKDTSIYPLHPDTLFVNSQEASPASWLYAIDTIVPHPRTEVYQWYKDNLTDLGWEVTMDGYYDAGGTISVRSKSDKSKQLFLAISGNGNVTRVMAGVVPNFTF